MQALEEYLSRASCHELEAALRVFDATHCEEPHKRVEAVHEHRAEHGPLRH